MYHRLFLGFAAYDIIYNLTFLVGTWAMPKDKGDQFWAAGTKATCVTQSFFSQLGSAVFLYPPALCICSFYAVRYDCKEEVYTTFERKAHLACTILPLISAALLIVSDFGGVDEIRCWVPVARRVCSNQDFTKEDETLCEDGYPTLSFQVKTIAFASLLFLVSAFVCIVCVSMTYVVDRKKRYLNQFLQGKRLYIETARKNKSRQNLVLGASHAFVSIFCNALFLVGRMLAQSVVNPHVSFAIILAGLISTTLTGFFNVLIYLKVKKPQYEDTNSELLAKHSMRKSIRSVEHIFYVTGGYKPKLPSKKFNGGPGTATNTIPDFGIFMGGDEEDDFSGDEDSLHAVTFRLPVDDTFKKSVVLEVSQPCEVASNSSSLDFESCDEYLNDDHVLK